MVRNSWKSWVVLGVAVAVFAASGVSVMASNFGFKINKQLFSIIGGVTPQGDNYLSLPYNSPYTGAKGLCNAIGATSVNVRVITANPAAGTLTTFFCNQATAGHCLGPVSIGGCVALAGGGFPPRSRAHMTRVLCGIGTAGCVPDVDPGAPVVGASVLVGSSLDTENYAGIVHLVDNPISVPYHTTDLNSRQLCLTQFGATPNANQRILRLNAATGVFQTQFCNSVTPVFTLVMGEGVIVRDLNAGGPNAPKPIPHF